MAYTWLKLDSWQARILLTSLQNSVLVLPRVSMECGSNTTDMNRTQQGIKNGRIIKRGGYENCREREREESDNIFSPIYDNDLAI